MSNCDQLEKLGIDLKKKKSGTLKTTCPNCSQDRKNKKDPCLSVDIDEGVYNCHHCDFKGRVFIKTAKEYIKPLARLEKIGQKALQFFENDRKISNNTLLRMKVTEAEEFIPGLNQKAKAICFNYYRKDELVNIKFRGPNKSFMMAKDAELIFYNLDAIDGEDSAIIVEGEIDCLTLVECGIYNSVSVPNGASKGNQKLEYLDNCWEYFKDLKKVILAVDDDEAGRALREELARRIGKEKCWTIEYPQDCKDANEVLVRHGKTAVAHMIENAKEWPLEGVLSMADIFPIVDDWYENGYPEGAKCGIRGIDHMMRFAPGAITTITGIPGHGKDEMFNWIMTGLAKTEGWRIGVCGFEETPMETVTKLSEKISGKSFAFRRDPNQRMSRRDFDLAIGLIDAHFHFYNTDEGEVTIDGILKTAFILVLKFGINALYLNPWNWIEHSRDPGQSETEYVSFVYSKIIRFARKHGVHVFLIAHTTKMIKDKVTKKYEIPTLYNISGSANFYNKTHYGITIYRHFDTGLVDVYFQKIKQSWMGQIGYSTFEYNTFTRQYTYVSSSVDIPEELPGWRKIDYEKDKDPF